MNTEYKDYYDSVKVALIRKEYGHLIDKWVGVINNPSQKSLEVE